MTLSKIQKAILELKEVFCRAGTKGVPAVFFLGLPEGVTEESLEVVISWGNFHYRRRYSPSMLAGGVQNPSNLTARLVADATAAHAKHLGLKTLPEGLEVEGEDDDFAEFFGEENE